MAVATGRTVTNNSNNNSNTEKGWSAWKDILVTLQKEVIQNTTIFQVFLAKGCQFLPAQKPSEVSKLFSPSLSFTNSTSYFCVLGKFAPLYS